MAPSRLSPSSSGPGQTKVNATPSRPRRPRPEPSPEPPDKPPGTDRVLGLLRLLCAPRDPVDTEMIAAIGNVALDLAVEIREWARRARRWPYRPPEARPYAAEGFRKGGGG